MKAEAELLRQMSRIPLSENFLLALVVVKCEMKQRCQSFKSIKISSLSKLQLHSDAGNEEKMRENWAKCKEFV